MAQMARIGSISHGTLRPADLIVSFADELREYAPDHERVREADAVQTLWASGWNDIYDESENISELINDLQDALSEHAPPYAYFGTREGDGSDFGFWPDMGAIEELAKFNDLADVPENMEDDYCVVNDHGNVSVYSADGTLIWDCV